MFATLITLIVRLGMCIDSHEAGRPGGCQWSMRHRHPLGPCGGPSPACPAAHSSANSLCQRTLSVLRLMLCRRGDADTRIRLGTVPANCDCLQLWAVTFSASDRSRRARHEGVAAVSCCMPRSTRAYGERRIEHLPVARETPADCGAKPLLGWTRKRLNVAPHPNYQIVRCAVGHGAPSFHLGRVPCWGVFSMLRERAARRGGMRYGTRGRRRGPRL